MISHFSQEPFEGTLHIKDADLQKMAKVLNDVNIKECPYFDLSDKYGNSARYYRENQWIPCSERLPEDEQVVLVQDTEGSMWIWKYFSENLKYRSPYQWEDENGEWQVIDEVVAWMPLPEPWKGEEQ